MKEITERVKAAAVLVLADADQMSELAEFAEAIRALPAACDETQRSWDAGEYRQIGSPQARRRMPLRASDIAHELRRTVKIDALEADLLIDSVLYRAEGE